MNVNVRLKKETEAMLMNAVKFSGKAKNAVINEAILLYAKQFDHSNLQEEVNAKMRALNGTDKQDNTADLGDYD